MNEHFHDFIATAAFGLEGVVARELHHLGFQATAENGGAHFRGTFYDAYKASLLLRTADRVLCVLAKAEVHSFEDLYQLMLSVAWEKYLSRNTKIHISGKCVRSQLMSVRDCQAVGKKAVVTYLGRLWHISHLPENGYESPITISIVNDMATITLDMSGEALNRRGYRTWNGEAPLRETLAAALVELSPWKGDIPLYDPCCGTGTLLIEAAMISRNQPACGTRSFACEQYFFMKNEEMQKIRNECNSHIKNITSCLIGGSDINSDALKLCKRHITQSHTEDFIQVHMQDLKTIQLKQEHGVFILNPPYGERLGDQKSARELYREIGKLAVRHPGWSLCAITADPAFERYFGRKADHKRRLYNGRLECDYYIFLPSAARNK